MEKKIFKVFPGFERKKEKKFLEEMFLKGYKLVSIKRNTYYFEVVKPENVTYEFDFQTFKYPKKEREREYLSFISKWNFTANRGPYYWFYIIKNKDGSNVSLFNNNESKMNFLKRQLKIFILFSVFLIFNSSMLLLNTGIIFTYMGALSIILTVFYFYEVIKFYIRYREVKNDILE